MNIGIGTRRDCEQLQSNIAPLPYADETKKGDPLLKALILLFCAYYTYSV